VRVKTIAIVQNRVARNGKADNANDWPEENDCDGYFAGLRPAFGSWAAKAIQEEKRPDEVELFFYAEGPEVLQGPHQAERVIMKKEERADDVELEDGQPACPAQEQKDSYVDIERRQNAHGAAEVKAAQADGAAFFVLAKQKACDEIAADDEEDEDAGGSVEDAHPEERDRGRNFKALEAVESENEKDGERAETIETGDAMHGGSTPRGWSLQP
jgi:hypothetical protein